jgi:hypothetical protein
LETKGTVHGKSFSLQPLINALQMFVDNAENVWKYDQRAYDHWRKVIGGVQRLLPAHIVNEYCYPNRSFSPCPEFKEGILPRNRVCEVYNGSQWIMGEWFTSKYSGGGVGETFAFYRAWDFYGHGDVGVRDSGGGIRVLMIACDLKAVQSLFKTRTQQLELLASQLKKSSPSLRMTS